MTTQNPSHAGNADFTKSYNIWSVIGASSAGTLIEWYDFYIFGSLATVISTYFFPKDDEAFAIIATLALFATGFIVRPFGAIIFGRLGDIGRGWWRTTPFPPRTGNICAPPT